MVTQSKVSNRAAPMWVVPGGIIEVHPPSEEQVRAAQITKAAHDLNVLLTLVREVV